MEPELLALFRDAKIDQATKRTEITTQIKTFEEDSFFYVQGKLKFGKGCKEYLDGVLKNNLTRRECLMSKGKIHRAVKKQCLWNDEHCANVFGAPRAIKMKQFKRELDQINSMLAEL